MENNIMANAITEENLLAILMQGKKLEVAMEQLKEGMFSNTLNKLVFRTIQELYYNNDRIDLITIFNSNRNEIGNLGGITKLTDISSGYTSDKNYKFLAEKVIENYNRTNLFNLLSKNLQDLQEGKEIEKVVAELTTVDEVITDKNIKEEGSILADCEKLMQEVENAMNNGGGVTGMKRGIACIDEKTNGKILGDYDCIAGRPGSGKTTYAINEIVGLLYNGYKVEFYSLEMTKEQILLKLACRMKSLDTIRVQRGEITKEQQQDFSIALIELMNYESEGMFRLYAKKNKETDGTVEDIVARARKSIKASETLGTKKTDVIYIDHIGIVGTRRDFVNTVAEVKYKSTMLRGLALELDVNITVLSQLSRACEQRADHRPILSDLRESGDLEQDLCNVLFIYRDEYYNKDTEDKGIMECIMAKCRMGTTGTEKLLWLPQYSLCVDIECENIVQ